MSNEKIYKPLNEKQITAIGNFLATRFGYFGVKSFEVKYEVNNERPVERGQFSCLIPNESLGIFRFALKECHLVADVRTNIYERRCVTASKISCSLHYTHIDNGTNGCNLDVNISCFEDGKIVEIYKK